MHNLSIALVLNRQRVFLTEFSFDIVQIWPTLRRASRRCVYYAKRLEGDEAEDLAWPTLVTYRPLPARRILPRRIAVGRVPDEAGIVWILTFSDASRMTKEIRWVYIRLRHWQMPIGTGARRIGSFTR